MDGRAEERTRENLYPPPKKKMKLVQQNTKRNTSLRMDKRTLKYALNCCLKVAFRDAEKSTQKMRTIRRSHQPGGH